MQSTHGILDEVTDHARSAAAALLFVACSTAPQPAPCVGPVPRPDFPTCSACVACGSPACGNGIESGCYTCESGSWVLTPVMCIDAGARDAGARDASAEDAGTDASTLDAAPGTGVPCSAPAPSIAPECTTCTCAHPCGAATECLDCYDGYWRLGTLDYLCPDTGA